MRIGLFGGSFNPVHNGHVRLAREFKELLSLDKIIIMPVSTPPHKEDAAFADSGDRFNMCRLAFCEDYFEVSLMEIERGGKSYTVDTVNAILGKYPGAELFLLVGSDMLLSFNEWYKYEEILEHCTLCAVSRKQGEDTEMMRAFARERLNDCADRIIITSVAPFEIASTQLREAIRNREDIDGYLPKKVKDYIESRGLYIE